MDERLERIAPLNYWTDANIEQGFIRKNYLDKILSAASNRVIKVLVGQRRAGKSYLLRQVIRSLIENNQAKNNQILYINKEFYRYDFLQSTDDLISLFEQYRKEINPNEKCWLFLDEIHNISGWERVVNSLSQDPTIDCEIFLTGSNSKLLSSEIATMLSGRYIEFEVLPFGYEEFVLSRGLSVERSTMINYLKSGGLPEFLNLKTEQTYRNYVESVKNTVLLKDIVERRKIKDVFLLEQIFAYMVNNTCSLVSINNIVNYLNNIQQKKDRNSKKQNYETVSNYISYLEDSFLLLKAQRYDVKGKEILQGTAKYYTSDNCYHNYLYEGYGYGQGALLENYVYQVLRRAGYNVYVGKVLDKEIDFIAINNDKKLYVQSCWTMDDEQTAQREYNSLLSIADNYPKIIVSMDDIAHKDKDGIINIQAWNFERWLNN